MLQIDRRAHERHGKALSNFKDTLPPADSDMAAQVFKDPYLFDFLGTADPRREREVEQALVDHIQRFLLELGSGFAFVGRQVRLEVGAGLPDRPALLPPEVALLRRRRTQGGALRSGIRGPAEPVSLGGCIKKPGRDLRDKVELCLAWRRVAREVVEGTLGGEFDRNDRAELQSKVKDAEEAAKDEVWGGYRFAVVADGQESDGLKVIDLGAGHSERRALCGRVMARSSLRRCSTNLSARATSSATGRRR